MSSNVTAAPGEPLGSPEVNPRTLKPERRAIKDACQAANLVKTLVHDNEQRNKRNARIMAKYNSERPYEPAKLESEGLAWKSNFSTKPLTALVDRVSSRFVTAVDALRYFTSSKLPETVPGATAKTEAFRREVTATIRARPGFRSFLTTLTQENSLFGYQGVGWLDRYSWFPREFRQDRFFVPAGTKQTVEDAEVVVFFESYLPHEVLEMIENRDAAAALGWNVNQAVDAVNNAMPNRLRSAYSDMDLVYQDLIREANMSASYLANRTVDFYSILVREVSGKVSHWRVPADYSKLIDSRSSDDPLFLSEDAFESMADAVTFFSYQQGNGTMHGSKGIGRELYSVAGIIDRARNEVVDRLQLSGKLVLQGDEKMLRRFRMSVLGNAVLIGSGYNVIERKIDANVDEFFTLDQYLVGLIDQLAGNVSPKQLQGERVTKAQVDFFASREEESKDVVIARFLIQFSQMVATMQRRMCNRHVADKDAKEMQERLLKVMSREELDMIAKSPTASVVRDYSERERQMVTLIATEKRGHPLYNQKELERRDLIAKVDADFAEAVLLPDNDPTETAEQHRLQLLEVSVLQNGVSVPVSPRDNHIIHLDVLREVIGSSVNTLAEDPSQMPIVRNLIEHAKLHIQAGADSDSGENYSGYAAEITELESRLRQLEAHEKAVQESIAAGGDPGAAVDAGAVAAVDASPVPPQQQ